MKRLHAFRRNLVGIALIGLALSALGVRANATAGIPVNPNATQKTKDVLAYLNTLSNSTWNGSVSGQMIGSRINDYSDYINHIYNVSGQWTGELTAEYAYDREYTVAELFDANDTLVQHWNKGGIVSIAWSATDPNGGPIEARGNVYDLNRLITPSDPLYPKWIAKLDVMAAGLQDLQNRGVVVIFRPLQEMNNAVYWWAKSSISSPHLDYIPVWQHMYNYFTNTKHLNNLIWVFSPSCTPQSYSTWPYPGDGYVDIVAGTAYADDLLISGYNDLTSFPKVYAMAEYANDPNTACCGQFDTTKYNTYLSSNYPKISYWTTWGNWTGVVLALADNLNCWQLMNNYPNIIKCPVPCGIAPVSDTVPPSIPASPSVTSVGPNSVTLSWSASTDNVSLKGYDIFYDTTWWNGLTRANPALGSISGTSFTVTGLAASTAYELRIRAVDAAGNQSGTVLAYATTSAGSNPPGPPMGVIATAGDSQAAISWWASPGATSYNVKRSTVSGSGYATVATGLTGTSYTNTGLINGTNYYFVATAVSGGGESGLSREAPVKPFNNSTSGPAQVNCGGDVAQGAFVADCDFSGGATATNWTGTIDTSAVTSPAPQGVYQSERWGNSTYTFPGLAANAGYTVRLHFCENSWTATGIRKFNVAIQGAQVLTNFDVFANAGAAHKANIQQLGATADANGKITIVFTTVTDNAEVNGIEIVGPPSAPTGLAATAGDGNAILTWTAGNSATSYNVYRGTTAGGESGIAIATGIASTTYTNTGLTDGTVYYYTVKSVNAQGTSGASNEASVTPTATFKINAGGPAVSPFAADMGFTGGNAATNWTGAIDTSAVTNPAPQAVYQSERWGASTYTVPNLRASTSYTVRLHFCENYWTVAGARKFNVTINGTQVLTNFDIFATAGAIHKANVQQFIGTSDAGGNIAVAFTNVTDNALINGIEVLGATSPPPTPTGLTATAGNAQVALSWSASSGATSYNVKRSTVSGSGYVTAASPTTTSYTNTGLTNGTTYYFVVSAVNTAGESANSAQASATPVLPIPPIPTGLSAIPANAQVYLTWNASTGAATYNVKRSTVSGSGYVTCSSPTVTYYTNTGLTNGTTYYYVVTAVNASGESANSAQVSAKPSAALGISINFIGTNVAMGAAESAGVVAATNWNNETGAAQATGQALVDSTAAATGATVTWSAAGTWALPITDAAGNVRMMKGYLDTSNTSTTTVTVSGLPALYTGNGYDVIVYTDHDNATATRTANYTIGGTTIPSTDNANTNFAGSYTQGNNYVRFTSLTGASFTLSATPNTSTDANKRAPVNGIQIVPHTIAINAAGPNVTPFIADASFSGGTAVTNWTGAVNTTAVTNPAPQAVYQSERYGTCTYTIGGFTAYTQHTVRLHFTEDVWTAASQRKFNVSINGTQVLTNFDIFATAGAQHKANIQQFTATANASGQFVIVFTTVVDNAKIDGIEVI